MALPIVTTKQDGHFETTPNGARAGVQAYQPRPPQRTFTQVATVKDGTVVATPSGAVQGSFGYPE